jgi:hypothetical protein
VAEGSNGFIENLVTELSNPAHIFADQDYEMNANKEFLINVSKCNLSLFALKRLIYRWTDEGIENIQDCPFDDETFIFVCNLFVHGAQRISAITENRGCNCDIPNYFVDRVASREELFQGWSAKGFRFLTPYWAESFKSHIRDPSTSTFADEFGCISSILASHTDFIHDLAWRKLCEDWKRTTIEYNVEQLLFVMKVFAYILTDMIGIQPTPDQYTAASEAFQQITCFCDTESFSEYMDEILKHK